MKKLKQLIKKVTRWEWSRDGKCEHHFKWGMLNWTSWGGIWLMYSPGNSEEPFEDEGDPRFTIWLGKFYLNFKVTVSDYRKLEPGQEVPWYGLILRPFNTDMYGRYVAWYWHGENYYWHMPWEMAHVRHEKFTDAETHDYTYVLQSGEVQHRKATIVKEEREWRWRWLTKLPYPRYISRYIDITFDDEVGERTGSWKGGTLGCGYDMEPGETPLQCLRRMEMNRKF